MLKGDTIVDSPEDVKGVLGLCHVLVKGQRDATVGVSSAGRPFPAGYPGMRGSAAYETEEMAEEQGYIARLIHLFRAEDLDRQFEASPRFTNAFFHVTFVSFTLPSSSYSRQLV